MTANEMLDIVKNGIRSDAVKYGIKNIEDKIRDYAEKGYRECYVSFYSHSGAFKDFKAKYPDAEYREFNIESEIKEYFTKNGFRFKLITDDICGGVRQAPYWVICW